MEGDGQRVVNLHVREIMMDKRILIGIVALICLVGGVTAQHYIIPEGLGLAEFTIPEKNITEYSGVVTFLADGKPAECQMNEQHPITDSDFEDCLESEYTGMKITNATDWLGRPYLMNTVTGERSFNESEIKTPEE